MRGRELVVLWIVALALICWIGCDKNPEIDVEEPDEPYFSSVSDSALLFLPCDNSSVNWQVSAVIKNIPSTGGYVWSALKNFADSYIEISEPQLVSGFEHSEYIEVSHGIDLQYYHDPDYRIYFYFTRDESKVGSLDGEEVIGGPVSVYVPSSVGQQRSSSQCIEIIQGDTVYFTVQTIGTLFSFVATTTPNQTEWEFDIVNSHIYPGTTLPTLPILNPSPTMLRVNSSRSDGGFFTLTHDTPGDLSTFNTLVATRAGSGTTILKADLRIRRPSRLGNTFNAFDTSICKAASKYRIPVALFKALVDQESRKVAGEFDTRTFRYEPCYDRDYITHASGIFSPCALTFNEFSGVRLRAPGTSTSGFDNAGTFDLLTRGATLITADTLPAVEVYGGSSYVDLNSDNYLTAAEYYTKHDGWQNWSTNSCPPNSNFDFVAQTTIASSYGIVQILYGTAVTFPVFWKDGTGRNPSKLFSPELGLHLAAKKLSYFHGTVSGVFIQRWRSTLLNYNGSSNPDYDDDIFEKIPLFSPIP